MTTNGSQFSGEAVECGATTTTTTTQSKLVVNKFINDGSFLETFKKMQQEQEQQKLNQPSKKQEPLETINQSQSTSDKHIKIHQEINSPNNSTAKVTSNDDQTNDDQQQPKDNQIKLSHNNKIMVGKRRNQKLKVGIIKRSRKESDSDNEDLDAWAKYMKEVRQYKEKYGDDSDKKRPLVK